MASYLTNDHQELLLPSISNQSNLSGRINQPCEEDNLHVLVSKLIPLVKSVKDILESNQIQRKDVSQSVSFPLVCRVSQQTSLFLNDMTMIVDLLRHDKEKKMFMMNQSNAKNDNNIPGKIGLTRSHSNVVETDLNNSLHGHIANHPLYGDY